jgi:hypothetical protein
METSTTFIGLGLVLITLLPIFLLLRGQHIKKSNINNQIKTLSNEDPKQFTIREFQNGKVVALNPEKNKLVFIDFNAQPETALYIDLQEVASCEMKSQIDSSFNQKKDLVVKVELILHLKNKTNQILKFYDFEYEKPIQTAYFRDNQLAEKWFLEINKRIV